MNIKIFALIYFCMQISCLNAMWRSVVGVALATTPVTIPGTYYYFKNNKVGGRRHENMYKSFVGGAVFGAFPLVNVYTAIPMFFDWLRDDYDNLPLPTASQKACIKGFLAGLSLYVTVPGVYELLRKCPK